jgi:hypothetical protein
VYSKIRKSIRIQHMTLDSTTHYTFPVLGDRN